MVDVYKLITHHMLLDAYAGWLQLRAHASRDCATVTNDERLHIAARPSVRQPRYTRTFLFGQSRHTHRDIVKIMVIVADKCVTVLV